MQCGEQEEVGVLLEEAIAREGATFLVMLRLWHLQAEPWHPGLCCSVPGFSLLHLFTVLRVSWLISLNGSLLTS